MSSASESYSDEESYVSENDLIDPKQPMPGAGSTALHLAAATGAFKAMQVLLEAIPTQMRSRVVNLTTTNRETALHYATTAPRHNVELVKLLLDAGADPSVQTSENTWR